MDRISEIVCAVLRESLCGEAFDEICPQADKLDDQTKNSVCTELKMHGVLCLADKWLTKHPLQDLTMYESWRKQSRDQQIRLMYALSGQQNALKVLKENGVDAVVIKGAAAAIYYPDPFLRVMGDIDLLVKREDLARAAEALESNGFIREDASLDEEHHLCYRKFGLLFELHRRLPIVDENNEELLHFFEKGIDERITETIECISFPMLPHRLNGIVLLFHINQHLRVGLGLRQITDWMEFVDKHIDNEAWEKEYREVLEKLSLDKFAKTVTEMCKLYLGLRREITWCEGVDASVCDSFFEYIIKKGTFGIKAGEEGRVASAFLRSTNPFKIIARLQKKGLVGWEAANKHRILRPFAWIYQFKEERKRLKRSNMTLKKLKSLKDEGLRERALIEAIGLDADRTIYERD